MRKNGKTDNTAVHIIIAIVLFAISLLLLTCFVLGEKTGTFGTLLCGFFRGLFGPLCFLLPLGTLAVSFFYRELSVRKTLVFKVIMLLVFCILSSSLYSLVSYGGMAETPFSVKNFYSDGVAGDGGGVIGSAFAKLFDLLFGKIMAIILTVLAVPAVFCFLPGERKTGIYRMIYLRVTGKCEQKDTRPVSVKPAPKENGRSLVRLSGNIGDAGHNSSDRQSELRYRPMRVDTTLTRRSESDPADFPEVISEQPKKELKPSDVGFYDFGPSGVFVTKDFDSEEDNGVTPDEDIPDIFGAEIAPSKPPKADIYSEQSPETGNSGYRVNVQKPKQSTAYGKNKNEDSEMPRAYSPFANPFISLEDFKKGAVGKKTEKSIPKSTEPPRAYSPFADPFASMNAIRPEHKKVSELPQSYIACDVAKREPVKKSSSEKNDADDDEDDVFIRQLSGTPSASQSLSEENKLKQLKESYAVPDKPPAQGENGIYPENRNNATQPQLPVDNDSSFLNDVAPSVDYGGSAERHQTENNNYRAVPESTVYEAPKMSVSENPVKPGAGRISAGNRVTLQSASNVSSVQTGLSEEQTDDDEEEADDDYDESGTVYYGHRRLRYPDYVFPRSDLLERQPMANITTEEEIAEVQRKLMEKISSFHVDATLAGYSIGPTITRHDIVPGPGVKIKALTALTDDISLAMQSEGVRISPVPGKAVVGVEVPNKKVTTVSLRSLIENRDFVEAKNKTTVCVGLTVTGKPVFMDIDEMPHVLIAGQTKSGKSVAINCMLLSLLFRATPDEVQLILIDPKRVELNIYSNLPHLIMPVIDDPQRAAAALNWAVAEMERRYELFDKVMARNTDEYYAMKDENPDFEYMPRIIIVIDELADLMLQVREHVEEKINRLAAKARACGMYLLIGTQRPSVDIITGLIKANIPARISFKVSSPQDSRIILGNTGAEKLLGKGDMLYHPTGGTQQRLQGAFVSGAEIKRVTKFIIDHNGNAQFDPEVMYSLESEVDKMNKAGKKASGDDEVAIDCADVDFEYLCKAAELVINMGKATTNIIQRHLKIGFNRASNITEKLEELGFISKSNGSKPRDVLIDMQGYLEWKNNQSK